MTDLARQVQARIVLLGLLNNKPEEPSTLELPPDLATTPQLERSARLALRHETSIVQHLAFICAYSDNPLHVLALCIQEECSQDRLTIKFAANSGQHAKLLVGLRPISNVLENESRGVDNRAENESRLLSAIIAVNRLRIFSRIRSKHALSSRKVKGKPSLLSRLETAERLLQSRFDVLARSGSAFAQAIRSVRDTLSQVERMDTVSVQSGSADQLLSHIVRNVNSLLQNHEDDFQKIPVHPPLWQSKATEALLDRLKKLSHYITACDELLKAARRYRQFTNVDFSFVNNQQSGSGTAQDVQCLRNLITNYSSQNNPARLYQGCGQITNIKHDDCERLFRTETRIHSELQLVQHYDQNTKLARPRVICSTKSACYLCSLFLRLHGQYLTPKTHGKLYSTWRWPQKTPQDEGTSNFTYDNVLPAFSSALDRAIRTELNSPTSTRRGDPLESTVNFLTVMTPTNLSYSTDNTEGSAAIATTISPSHARCTVHAKSLRQHRSQSDRDSSMEDSNHSMLAGQNMVTTEPRAERFEETISAALKPPRFMENSCSSSELSTACHDPGMLQPSIEPLCMTKGDKTLFRFDRGYHKFEVRAPGLHLILAHEFPPTTSLRISIEVLDDEPCDDLGVPNICSFDDKWAGKSVPDGILFSQAGLVLKRKSTWIRLRARL